MRFSALVLHLSFTHPHPSSGDCGRREERQRGDGRLGGGGRGEERRDKEEWRVMERLHHKQQPPQNTLTEKLRQGQRDSGYSLSSLCLSLTHSLPLTHTRARTIAAWGCFCATNATSSLPEQSLSMTEVTWPRFWRFLFSHSVKGTFLLDGHTVHIFPKVVFMCKILALFYASLAKLLVRFVFFFRSGWVMRVTRVSEANQKKRFQFSSASHLN